MEVQINWDKDGTELEEEYTFFYENEKGQVYFLCTRENHTSSLLVTAT
jgi:hypothetical protein